MRKLRVVIVVADGLGDRPIKQLGGRTPLELAYKPNIDSLASESAVGLWDPIAPGIRPGSDTSHLSLFGVDPRGRYPGRGPFEAIGVGAELNPGDVALRGNFATVDDSFTVVDRRAGRRIPENVELVKYLNEHIGYVEDVKVEFYPATEHRLAVVLRGEGLSAKVSDTDPHEEGVKVLESKPLADEEGARKVAKVLNQLTRKTFELLSKHEVNRRRREAGLPPVNVVLFRGAGKMIKYPKLQEREGIHVNKAVVISATAMIKGVCKLLGMEVVTPPGATGGVDSDLMSKARAAVEYWRKGYDLIYVHIKGTDAASHDGKPDVKKKVIERVDEVVGYISRNINLDNAVLVFTGDHSTPISVRDHTADPVPVMIHAPNVFADGIGEFSERAARKGSLGRLRGPDLFNTVMDLAGRTEKFGA